MPAADESKRVGEPTIEIAAVGAVFAIATAAEAPTAIPIREPIILAVGLFNFL